MKANALLATTALIVVTTASAYLGSIQLASA